MVITVQAHEKTIPSSYKIHIVNTKYKVLTAVTMRQKGRSPGRYTGQFYPPSKDFRIILEGKTKEGRSFKRVGAGILKASTALIYVLFAPQGFTLTAGSRMPTTIVFAINNFGHSETFDVKINESQKYVQRHTKTAFVVSGRVSLIPVGFKAPKAAKSGSTHKVVVSVIGRRSLTRANIFVQLLIE